MAYSIDIERIRAIELGDGFRQTHDFGMSAALLEGFDAVRGELGSPAALSRPSLEEVERFAGDWGRQLLPATWLKEPPEYAVLIPHAYLHGLPLHLVRVDSGRPLCAETAVSLCSSLTLLRRCMDRSPPTRGDRCDLFLADGAQPNGALAAGTDVLGANDEAWRGLPGRLLSACNVATSGLNPAAAQRGDIGEVLCKQAYELILVAAHGFHDPLDALASGLLLRENLDAYGVRPIEVMGNRVDRAGVPFVIQDLPARELSVHLRPTLPAELLSLAELERAAHVVCPLVALLGCSTGRAVLYPGDQPLSLAEVFLRIGAAAVVAPMWDVTVGAVELWMQEFLNAYLVEGASRGEAARRASRNRHDDGAMLHEAGCMVLRGDFRERSPE